MSPKKKQIGRQYQQLIVQIKKNKEKERPLSRELLPQPHGYKNYLKRNKQDIWNILINNQ